MINAVLRSILSVSSSTRLDGRIPGSRTRGTFKVRVVGPDADRILLVIDRPPADERTLSQELGFAGHLARRLTALSGRGTDLEILSDGALTAEECRTALATLDLARFDVIVLMVGTSEALALTSTRKWSADLTLLLDGLEERTPIGMHTFVVAIPPLWTMIGIPRQFVPIVRSSIRRLNAASIVACTPRTRMSLLPFELPVADDRRLSSDFGLRAELIAPAIHERLDALGNITSANEAARLLSVDELPIIDTYPSAQIDRLVAAVRSRFGMATAAVTFLDHDRRWVKSAVGETGVDTPRVGSLCDLALEQADVFIVEDIHNEPRIDRSADSTERMRFYAGFPLEAPTGRRVGVLFIMDDKPRVFAQTDSALLRELALEVQSELWASSI